MTWGSSRNITATTSWNLEHNLKFRKRAWRSELMLGSCAWTLLALSKLFESERLVESFGRTVAALINVVCDKTQRLCDTPLLRFLSLTIHVHWCGVRGAQPTFSVCFVLRKERWKIPGSIFKVSLYLVYTFYFYVKLSS